MTETVGLKSHLFTISGPVRTYTPEEREAWERSNTAPLPELRLNVLRHQRRGREIEAERTARFAAARAARAGAGLGKSTTTGDSL